MATTGEYFRQPTGRKLIAFAGALALAWATTLVFAPRAALACSCGGRTEAESQRSGRAIAEADGAFVGTLVSKDAPPYAPPGAIVNQDPPVLHHFVVERIVKGPIGPTVDVLASQGDASCGIHVGIGDRVPVVVHGGPPDPWRAAACDQVTFRSTSVNEDTFLAATGLLDKPWALGSVGVGVLLVVATLALTAVRRRGVNGTS